MPSNVLDYQPRRRRSFIRDDVAYVLPMAVFLIFTQVGVSWPSLYPASYVVKTIVVAILLAMLWRHFTKIRWNYWWLGVVFGIVGIVQWVGMDGTENFLLTHLLHKTAKPATDAFNPFEHFSSSGVRWAFIVVRIAGATLLVPVMEELFWRDFLWRTIQAPNDFKLAEVGEIDWKVWIAVSIVFSFVHVQWMTAVVWGLMVGGLLMLTRSLGACIIMHGVTNLLLGIYVLKTGKWYFW
ncbi:MAG TPA: CAAX prenyl protease-related protein [Tepidisphaeraceae bacterium]|jgi:hypothetical protein|nr:CAAX prenyl protease-related protein [Tepidisphaeraceae bacterium]